MKEMQVANIEFKCLTEALAIDPVSADEGTCLSHAAITLPILTC